MSTPLSSVSDVNMFCENSTVGWIKIRIDSPEGFITPTHPREIKTVPMVWSQTVTTGDQVTQSHDLTLCFSNDQHEQEGAFHPFTVVPPAGITAVIIDLLCPWYSVIGTDSP